MAKRGKNSKLNAPKLDALEQEAQNAFLHGNYRLTRKLDQLCLNQLTPDSKNYQKIAKRLSDLGVDPLQIKIALGVAALYIGAWFFALSAHAGA